MKHGFTHIILIVILAVTLTVFGLVYFKSLQTTPYTNLNTAQTPIANAIQSATKKAGDTSDLKTYKSNELDLTFRYPGSYELNQTGNEYVSIISPLNSNKGKESIVQNGELKIEIYQVGKTSNLTLDEYVNKIKNDDIGTTSFTKIGGERSIIKKWQHEFNGETYYFFHKGKIYHIQKFPQGTSRQQEFDQILSTFQFIN